MLLANQAYSHWMRGSPPKYIHILFPQTYKCLGSQVSLFGKGVFTHVLEGFHTGPPWVMQVGEWQILLRPLCPFFSFLISPQSLTQSLAVAVAQLVSFELMVLLPQPSRAANTGVRHHAWLL